MHGYEEKSSKACKVKPLSTEQTRTDTNNERKEIPGQSLSQVGNVSLVYLLKVEKFQVPLKML